MINHKIKSSVDCQDAIEKEIYKAFKQSAVQGGIVSIVDKEDEHIYSYGYACKKCRKEVDADTIFEICSLSKAFTALGILLLEKEEKLNVKDRVCKYISWFGLTYQNHLVYSLRICDLLEHTSGIPAITLSLVSSGTSDKALEDITRKINKTTISCLPGEKYEYATVNYDILGYIIELVSKQTYEEYIEQNVLIPLGLRNTYLSQHAARKTGALSKGYGYQYGLLREYAAPFYRENLPAGYIYSNMNDMLRWMKIQLGMVNVPEVFTKLIRKSQSPISKQDKKFDYYCNGWNINLVQRRYFHSGNNPSFSSYILMDKRRKTGISILANSNSERCNELANNIEKIMLQQDTLPYKQDEHQVLDWIASTGSICFLAASGYRVHQTIQILSHKKTNVMVLAGSPLTGLLLHSILVFALLAVSIILLKRRFGTSKWKFWREWGSREIIHAFTGAIVYWIMTLLNYCILEIF